MKCKSQTAIYRSLLKYGWDNHTFEVIEECEVEKLNERERYWQEYYDVLGKKGLNCRLTETIDKSGVMSEESKKKLSIYWKGKVFSDETKRKISLALKGKPKSEKHKISLRNRDMSKNRGPRSEQTKINLSENSGVARKVLNLETGIYYMSIREASKASGIKEGTLYAILIGKNKNRTSYVII